MSACAEILSPSVVAASLIQSGSGIATERGPQQLIARCPDRPKERPDPAARRAADDALICKLGCCCLKTPDVSSDEHRLMQHCMDQCFDRADQLLDYNSRYKSEISYDMTQSPPAPLMHRVEGEDTTEATHSWMNRKMTNKVAIAGIINNENLPRFRFLNRKSKVLGVLRGVL